MEHQHAPDGRSRCIRHGRHAARNSCGWARRPNDALPVREPCAVGRRPGVGHTHPLQERPEWRCAVTRCWGHGVGGVRGRCSPCPGRRSDEWCSADLTERRDVVRLVLVVGARIGDARALQRRDPEPPRQTMSIGYRHPSPPGAPQTGQQSRRTGTAAVRRGTARISGTRGARRAAHRPPRPSGHPPTGVLHRGVRLSRKASPCQEGLLDQGARPDDPPARADAVR
jgi:hypothetical protein